MVDETNSEQVSPSNLSERVQKYTSEIESLIAQGIEHPRFEFKRSASITHDDLDERLDFIKLLQGVANSQVTGERFIVVGADPKDGQFYPVENSDEFDPARVSIVLAKYLDPQPVVEVFNNLKTKAGHALVVLILGEAQSRPIMVKTEGKKKDGKTRLQVGEIWIKKGTALQIASRSDLDTMYRQRMEEEAEDRARKRFKHFTELSGTPPTVVSSPTQMPVRELLVGPTAEFRRFAEELIARSEKARFLMLVELMRESLVEGWARHDIARAGFPQDLQQYGSQLDGFFRDEFLPSIQSIVAIGILIIKYDFQTEWLQSIINVLLEAFEESRNLQRLKSAYLAEQAKSLQWWRPGFELYVAIKTIAVFAVLRDKPRFLPMILQRLVVPLSIDNYNHLKTPVLFWPLPAQMFLANELVQGRAVFFWHERISNFWGSYFGTYEKFLAASCELRTLPTLLLKNPTLSVGTRKPDLLGQLRASQHGLRIRCMRRKFNLYLHEHQPRLSHRGSEYRAGMPVGFVMAITRIRGIGRR